jgi:hypothetical protein
MTAPTMAGPQPGSRFGNEPASSSVPRWGRLKASSNDTTIATAAPASQRLTINPLGAPIRTSPSATMSATPRSVPWRTPQPIDPNSHSPRNSVPPIASRLATYSATARIAPASAAMTLARPAISPSSALSRETCAPTRRLNARRVCPTCSRSPGFGPVESGLALDGSRRTGPLAGFEGSLLAGAGDEAVRVDSRLGAGE